MVFYSRFQTCLSGGFVDAAYPSLLEEAAREEARVDSFAITEDLQKRLQNVEKGRGLSSIDTRRGLEKAFTQFKKERGSLEVGTAAAILRKRGHPLVARTFENVVLRAGPDLPRMNRIILTQLHLKEGDKPRMLYGIFQDWENFCEKLAKIFDWETKPKPTRNREFGDVLDGIAYAKLANWDLLKLITYLKAKIPGEARAYWPVFIFYQVIDGAVLKGERIFPAPRLNFREIQEQYSINFDWDIFRTWAKKWEDLAKEFIQREAIRPEKEEVAQNRKRSIKGLTREVIFEGAAKMRTGKVLAVYNAFLSARMVFEAEVVANTFWGIHRKPRIPARRLPHADSLSKRGAQLVEKRLEKLGMRIGLHPKHKSKEQQYLSEGKRASYKMDKLFAQAREEGIGIEELYIRFVADSELQVMLGDRKEMIDRIFACAIAPNGAENLWSIFKQRFGNRIIRVTANKYRRKFTVWKKSL